MAAQSANDMKTGREKPSVESVARIYTGLIFPDALYTAEPDISDLQKVMLDATPDCIKVLSVEGQLIMMNRAGCDALGVADDGVFGMAWLPLLPAEVHGAGQAALLRASGGDTARFAGKSEGAGGVAYWDNLLTPLVDQAGAVLSILCVSRDVTATIGLQRELEQALEREKLLSGEMRHRIGNTFALVSGLITLSEKEAAQHPDPRAATRILREKLGALSRASRIALAADRHDSGTGDHCDLEIIVHAVLGPYGSACVIAGEQVAISGTTVTTIALVLHELATNSMKYGALGHPGGRVGVEWETCDGRLVLTWQETTALPVGPAPQKQGFGSEMLTRIVNAAHGRIERVWQPTGLSVNMELPAAMPS